MTRERTKTLAIRKFIRKYFSIEKDGLSREVIWGLDTEICSYNELFETIENMIDKCNNPIPDKIKSTD